VNVAVTVLIVVVVTILTAYGDVVVTVFIVVVVTMLAAYGGSGCSCNLASCVLQMM